MNRSIAPSRRTNGTLFNPPLKGGNGNENAAANFEMGEITGEGHLVCFALRDAHSPRGFSNGDIERLANCWRHVTEWENNISHAGTSTYCESVVDTLSTYRERNLWSVSGIEVISVVREAP